MFVILTYKHQNQPEFMSDIGSILCPESEEFMKQIIPNNHQAQFIWQQKDVVSELTLWKYPAQNPVLKLGEKKIPNNFSLK